MDKREFYDKLHQELADRFGLSSSMISVIRGFTGEGRSRKQIAEWLAYRVTTQTPRKKYPHAYYQEILNFVASCSPETWVYITRKTEYDKNEGGDRTTQHCPKRVSANNAEQLDSDRR